MTAFDPDPSRCVSTHWSLPVQCVLKRTHRENWHESWHPESGNRIRYRATVQLTQESRGGEWHDLVNESPCLTEDKIGSIRRQFGERPIVAELLKEIDQLTAELEQARAAAFHAAATAVMEASHGEPLRDAYAAHMRDYGLLRRLAREAAPACACGAEPVHQNGCEDGE